MSKIKKVLSLLLVLVLVCTGVHIVPGEVKAADENVVQTSITGIKAGTYSGDYGTAGFETKADPAGYFLWLNVDNSSLRDDLGWDSSTLSKTFNILVNGQECNAQIRVWNGNLALALRTAFISNITTLIGTAKTNITIRKGTVVSMNNSDKTLEFTKNFTYYNTDGSTWEILESTPVQFTGVRNFYDSYFLINLNLSSLPTDVNIFFHKIPVYFNDVKQELVVRTIKNNSIFRVNLDSSNLPTLATGLTVRIPAGTVLVPSASDSYKLNYPTPYELTTEFVAHYDGSSWKLGEYDPNIHTEITGFETEDHMNNGAADGINFHLKTTPLLSGTNSEYNFAANSTYFYSDEGKTSQNFTLKADDLDKIVQFRVSPEKFGGFWFTLLGAQNARKGYTISLTKDTLMYYGEYVFKLTDGIHIRYNGTEWVEITEEEANKTPIILSADTSTYTNGGVNDRRPGGTIDIYMNADLNLQTNYGISSGTYFGGSGKPHVVYINGVAHNYNIMAMGYYKMRLLWTDNFSDTADTTVVIPKGTLLEANGYTFEVSESYGLKYDGSNWSNYKIYDDVIELTITGTAYGLDTDCVNVKVDKDFITERGLAVGTVLKTSMDGVSDVEVKAADTLSFKLTGESDTFTIPADVELKTEDGAHTFKIINTYAAKYDGRQWLNSGHEEIDYHEISIAGIRSQGTGWIYLNTSATDEADSAVIGSEYHFSADGIDYTGAEAPNRLYIDSNSKALYFKYNATEFDTITFPAGTVLNNTDGNNTAIVIKEAFTMHFYQGYWMIDNDGPDILYNCTELADGDDITVYEGDTATLQDKFTARDEKTEEPGTVEFPDFPDTLETDQTYNIQVLAKDIFGNAKRINVTVTVRDCTAVDFHQDNTLDARDLVAMKKAIDLDKKQDTSYDLNNDTVVNDEDIAIMRKLLVGTYEIIDGGTIQPVYQKKNRITIFANWPADQTDAKVRGTYFDAGFTDLLMTEDYSAKIANGAMNSAYKNAIQAVQTEGKNVIIRNYQDESNYLTTDLATKIAGMNVTGIYYWDEPRTDSFTALSTLAAQHEQYNANSMFWTTLLPRIGFETDEQYQTYLDSYVSDVLGKVKTGRKVLAMDNYPLLYGSGAGGSVIEDESYYRVSSSYLTNLYEIASRALSYNQNKKAGESKMEVGAYIQVYREKDSNGKWKSPRAITSTSDVTYQTNVSLAMGANNLAYFLYSNHDDSKIEGICDKDGNITNPIMYNAVKEANKQIKKWDYVLKSFDWQGVKAYKATTGSTNREITTGEAIDALRNCAGYIDPTFTSLQSATVTQDSIISEFKDAEHGYYGYMAVNFSEPTLNRSCDVTMKFDSNVSKVIVYQEGVRTVQTITGGVYNAKIPAGGAVFVIPRR